MFPIWIILGFLLVLAGIFNNQILSFVGLKPMSEMVTNPNYTKSSRAVERITRWVVAIIGLGFITQGFNGILPYNLGTITSFILLGITGLMIFAMLIISVAN